MNADPQMAAYWYERSASHGYPMAKAMLAYHYHTGYGYRTDRGLAISLWTDASPVFLPGGQSVTGGLSFGLAIVISIPGAGVDVVSLLPAVGDTVAVLIQGKGSAIVLSGPLQHRPDLSSPSRPAGDRRRSGELSPGAEIPRLQNDLRLVHSIKSHGTLPVLCYVQTRTAHLRNKQVGSLLPVMEGVIHTNSRLPAHILQGEPDFSRQPCGLHYLCPHPDEIPHPPDQFRHPVFIVPHGFQFNFHRHGADIQAPCDRPRSGVHSGGLSRRVGQALCDL
ncbi:hypothetical protein [Aminivibrio sp.]|uniref:hypothetical protein n=1 Tax=Aminivibrio sp. TaxID=1872489 RepID=UPI003D9659FD